MNTDNFTYNDFIEFLRVVNDNIETQWRLISPSGDLYIGSLKQIYNTLSDLYDQQQERSS